MSRNAWIIFAVICAAVLGTLVFVARQNRIDVGDVNTNKIITASEANGNIADHVYGSDAGKTILVEYGDFQCPACRSAFPLLTLLKIEFKDDLTFIFRNSPLTQIHPNAKAAAAAAEAAGLQGKFWEMHDKLFEKQDEWASAAAEKRLSFFVSMAKEAGVKDIEKFKADIESKRVNDKITYDLALARKDGVNSTPTIFLDGKRIDSETWADTEKFKSMIQESINKHKKDDDKKAEKKADDKEKAKKEEKNKKSDKKKKEKK